MTFVIIVLLLVAAGWGLWWAAGTARSPDRPAAPQPSVRLPSRSGTPAAGSRSARTVRHPSGPLYRIEYGDAYGEVTARDVILLSVAQEPITDLLYLRTQCLLREAERTFRVDRILTASTENGAKIGDLRGHFLAQAPSVGGLQWWGGRSPEQVRNDEEHARVMERARAGINGLLWLAAADGEVSEPEMSVIFEWIDYRAKAARDGRSQWDQDAARQYIRTSKPTLAQLRGGLGRMGKAEAERFVVAMEALSAADGSVEPSEDRRRAQLVKCLPANVTPAG